MEKFWLAKSRMRGEKRKDPSRQIIEPQFKLNLAPLHDLQRRILTLMKIPEIIYALPVQT